MPSLPIQQAVLSTLAYFELFEVPLTRSELADYLLFLSPDDAELSLYLKDSSYVHERGGYFSSRTDEDFWQEWEDKKRRSQEFFKKVKRWNWLFSLCPFVRLVGVCNSLPISDVRENSDIDLFVVAKPGKLFTARLTLTILSSLFALRRHGKHVKGRFCLSFYVTEDALDLSPLALRDEKEAIFDPYLAFWLRSLEPVAGDYLIYESLLKRNRDWLSPYFHREIKRKRYFRRPKKILEGVQSALEWLLKSNAVETWCREKQWGRALSKYQQLEDKSGTVISNQILKFHDHDARLGIRTAWQKKLERII